MQSIEITGFRPYDGRYDLIPFNRYEQGQIRRLTGWMPLQYEEALAGGDAEFIAALAVLAMKRQGAIEKEEVAATFERILDMDDAEIRLISEPEKDEDAESRPPDESSSSSGDTSTLGSSKSSETSETTPEVNGTDGSAISGLHRVRSVS